MNILVLFGGMAEEHEVSIKSAKQLMKWLDAEKFSPIYVYIGKDGAWTRVPSPEGQLEGGAPALFSVNRGMPGLFIQENGQWKRERVDAAFPMLHGKYGEDGSIQGLLALSGLPCVGCDVYGSALCMDKALSYLVASGAGIRVPRHVSILPGEAPRADGLTYPVFVKPARSGSSFGVSQVFMESGLADAVGDARRYGGKVLIEETVRGREIGCAVLDGENGPITGEPDEISLSGGFFRIHQEKQPERGSGNAQIFVPARITREERARAVDAAKRVYRALGLQGLARVDMFLTEEGEIVLNEVNTMPGFTSYSRYPRMMEAAGISMKRAISMMIERAAGKAC